MIRIAKNERGDELYTIDLTFQGCLSSTGIALQEQEGRNIEESSTRVLHDENVNMMM